MSARSHQVRRLLLIRHATTEATHRAAFPVTTGRTVVAACAALDEAGTAMATALAPAVPHADRCWTSHARRAVETARCLGLEPDLRIGGLAEADFGRWAGATLDDVYRRDPEGLAAWLADPGCTPHAGEPLAEVRRRAARVLDTAHGLPGTTFAISHGGLIKAAVLEVLGSPDTALWRIGCAPASVTELQPTHDGWQVVAMNWTPAPPARLGTRLGQPVGADAASGRESAR